AEIVRDGETGILVAPCDAVALSQAVERLATDDALRERLRRPDAAAPHTAISQARILLEALRRLRGI
ncbi:MAG: glycosyltransferase family 4 protein, partial [Actinomycetota bacterium]